MSLAQTEEAGCNFALGFSSNGLEANLSLLAGLIHEANHPLLVFFSPFSKVKVSS